MEVLRADDDLRLVPGDALDLISPFADRLDDSLDCLGPGVHRQDLVRAGEGGELFVEVGKLVVAESPRGKRQLAGLLGHGRKDFRMAVTLVDRRICGQAIEIAIAVGVPDIHAFAT